jgi:hypothetical protein
MGDNCRWRGVAPPHAGPQMNSVSEVHAVKTSYPEERVCGDGDLLALHDSRQRQAS